jgi:hypothetical protein
MYAIMNIAAPAILLVVSLYMMFRFRKPQPNEERRAHRGAKELREQLNEEDTGVSNARPHDR